MLLTKSFVNQMKYKRVSYRYFVYILRYFLFLFEFYVFVCFCFCFFFAFWERHIKYCFFVFDFEVNKPSLTKLNQATVWRLTKQYLLDNNILICWLVGGSTGCSFGQIFGNLSMTIIYVCLLFSSIFSSFIWTCVLFYYTANKLYSTSRDGIVDRNFFDTTVILPRQTF